jgi:hypothetical protein
VSFIGALEARKIRFIPYTLLSGQFVIRYSDTPILYLKAKSPTETQSSSDRRLHRLSTRFLSRRLGRPAVLKVKESQSA